MTLRPIIGRLLGWFGWILSSLVKLKPTHRYFFFIFLSLDRLTFRNKPKTLSFSERWPFLFWKSTKMASDRDFCVGKISQEWAKQTSERYCHYHCNLSFLTFYYCDFMLKSPFGNISIKYVRMYVLSRGEDKILISKRSRNVLFIILKSMNAWRRLRRSFLSSHWIRCHFLLIGDMNEACLDNVMNTLTLPPPRAAKTGHFVILTLSNARRFYSSKESLRVN